MKKLTLFCSLCLIWGHLSAQMWNGQDTLYGNEWIKYDQTYYKISVGDDGIYRLNYQSLSDVGVPVSSIAAEHFQLFYMGQEIPVFTTTDNIFGTGDFIDSMA